MNLKTSDIHSYGPVKTLQQTLPELFLENLEIFLEMISDSSDKVRIEAPEMFRVVGNKNQPM